MIFCLQKAQNHSLIRALPTILLTLPPSRAADRPTRVSLKTKLWGVCRGFVPDIQVCGINGREDLVNATTTSNAEEEQCVINMKTAVPVPWIVLSTDFLATVGYRTVGKTAVLTVLQFCAKG